MNDFFFLATASSGTSSSPLAQLFVLNEACEHLSIHKELQELADSAGGVRFAEIVSLELPASVGRLDHVQRIVAHQLHEEPHETLRHQRAQVSPLTWTGPRLEKRHGSEKPRKDEILWLNNKICLSQCQSDVLQIKIYTSLNLIQQSNTFPHNKTRRVAALSVTLTFTFLSICMPQNIFPLLQDLLQCCLQFTGQDAVFIAQLSHNRGRVTKSHDVTYSTNISTVSDTVQEPVTLIKSNESQEQETCDLYKYHKYTWRFAHQSFFTQWFK